MRAARFELRVSLVLMVSLFAAGSLTACGGNASVSAANGEGSNSEASATAELNQLNVSVAPPQTVAFPGDHIQLRSEVRGATDKTVVWTVSDGALDSQAVFTAPTVVGSVVSVTATASADGQSQASSTITVIAPIQARDGGGPGAALSVHTALGLPDASSTSDNDHLLSAKAEYVLSYDASRKTPTWVSWELNATYQGGATRTQTWAVADTTLPAGVPQPTNADYTHAGYDRGHMCPSADRTRIVDINKETFILTNVVPQLHALNSGPWQRLEEELQGLAANGKELFVMSGPVYNDAPATVGSGVAVPLATWKVAVVLDTLDARAPDVSASTRVIAVVMPNDGSVSLSDDWRTFRVRVRDIEAQTGLNLLSDVDQNVQDAIETRVDSQ